jgi:hypothetical protein
MNRLPDYRLWPWLIIGLLAMLVLGITHWTTTPAAVETVSALAAPDLSTTSSTEFVMASNTLSPICRFGVNVTADIDNFDITPLRMGWYLDYSARANPSQPNGVDYMPTIRLAQVRVAGQRTDDYTYTPSGTTLQNAIAGNPGAAWIIGNEPDRIEVQDDMEPHVYATAYHELYHLIKTADPSARIVAGSIVQPTPIRLLYLDLVLQAYLDQFGRPMPVDAWSIHNFILREVSCDYNHPDDEGCWGAEIPPGVNVDFGEIVTIEDNDNMTLFAERIVRFRQWMKDRGYGHLPLYLTEYGILMPEDFGFPPARVNAFMNNTYNYLRSAQDPVLGYPADSYRLVQKWSWFSIHHLDFNGDLFFNEPPYDLTPIGQNFADYTAPIATAVDLYPWQLATTAAPFISGGSPVTLTLQTTIANSGNLTEPTGPALVRFYDGDPQNGGTQIGGDQFVTVAGCGRTAVATITWPDVSPGVYTVYVWVDPNNDIAETNSNNNLQQFTVLVADPSLFLPLIARPGPGA